MGSRMSTKEETADEGKKMLGNQGSVNQGIANVYEAQGNTTITDQKMLENYKVLKKSGIGSLLEDAINEVGRVYLVPKDLALASEGSALAALKSRLCSMEIIEPLADLFSLCKRVVSGEPFHNEGKSDVEPLLSDVFGFDPKYIKGMWEKVDTDYENTWLIGAQCDYVTFEPPSIKDYLEIHKVMVECVPSIYRPYKWTEPKDISKRWSDTELLSDLGLGMYEEACILKLFMKGELPVLEVVAGMQKGNQANLSFANTWTERVTSLINAPIKEVYFLVGNQAKGYTSVIGRKNPDGEWTLTVY